jgi:predicted alpha/beta-hydrolase family hydrolase
MQRWAERFTALGVVETFDYPYMARGKRRPDPQPELIAAHVAALAAARARHPALPTVLVGKSMGSRIGCHVATVERVQAIVCLGYPLRGAGKNGKLRDQILLALEAPILFVQGTRDPLCPLDLLAAVRAKMNAPNELYVVEGGDHSLEVGRGKIDRDRRLELTEEPVFEAIENFVKRFA